MLEAPSKKSKVMDFQPMSAKLQKIKLLFQNITRIYNIDAENRISKGLSGSWSRTHPGSLIAYPHYELQNDEPEQMR